MNIMLPPLRLYLSLYASFLLLHLCTNIDSYSYKLPVQLTIASSRHTRSYTPSLALYANSRLEVETFVNFELEKLFSVSQFLEIYNSMANPVTGVYAIEDKNEDVQVVEASLDVYKDVESELNNYGVDNSYGVRVQTFKAPTAELLAAYRDELIRQTSPKRASQNQIGLGPFFKPPAVVDVAKQESIISPFAEDRAASVIATSNVTSSPNSIEVDGNKQNSVRLELTVENVNAVLDNIRPYLIADGGNVAVVEVDKYYRSITLALQGACGSCPSSTTTMKMGIERILKENFVNLGPITAVNPLLNESPTLTMLKEVGDSLGKIMPALKSMGGQVDIEDVSTEDGTVFVRFSGPEKLKKGVERVLKDSRLVREVIFKE